MTTTETLYLIEKSGDERQVWEAKSKSLAGAKREAGVRHMVATCSTGRLTNGCKIDRAALDILLNIGSVKVVG